MFPPLSSGTAELRVARVGGQSSVVGCCARNPLRILTPQSRGESVWAYASSFGGGMVAGDATHLHLGIDAGARCFFSTQSSTKIYRNPRRLGCSSRLHATLGGNSLLVLVPDPVQCFAEARYEQRQRFDLSATSSLVLLDWLSAGRTARGERWQFDRYLSRNEIFRDGERLLLDSMLLDAADGPVIQQFRGGRFNCIATVVLLGPLLGAHANEILRAIAQDPARPSDLLVSASPLREGAILRLAGVSVEQVGHRIHRLLQFVPELLRGNPWSRKW